jgi:hypothetical protein
LRLLRRLPPLYGSKFFDIVLLDALYAQSPVLKVTQESGGEVVISLKQNLPGLYQSAQRLFNRRDPDRSYTEQQDGKGYEIQLWDTHGLPFSNDNPEPVRVVRFQEVLTRNRSRQGEPTPHTTAHEWLWLTTWPAEEFSAAQVRTLGHARWKQENTGWNDLTQNWAFKHGFLHACAHRPKSKETSPHPCPTEAPQLTPNRGLFAVTLILLIAFALVSAFALRHSKLVALYHTTLAVSRQLYASAMESRPRIRGPD